MGNYWSSSESNIAVDVYSTRSFHSDSPTVDSGGRAKGSFISVRCIKD